DPVPLPRGATVPLLSRRRDPYWGDDGKAARSSRRKQGFVAVLAFATAFAAVIAAVIAWAGLLGVAPGRVPTGTLLPEAGDLGTRRNRAATGGVSVLLFAVVISTAAVVGRVLRPRDI